MCVMALLSFLRLDKPKSPSFIFQPSSTKISARKVSNYLAKKGNIKHSLDGFKSPCMMGGSWVCKKLSPRAMLRPICNFCCSSSTSCVCVEVSMVCERERGGHTVLSLRSAARLP